MADHDQCRLLTLPAELRTSIWALVVISPALISPARSYSFAYLEDDPVRVIRHDARYSFQSKPALLGVCSQIRSETLPMYCAENRFDFGCFIESDVDLFRSWWRSLGSSSRHIRRLRFVGLKIGSCGFHSFSSSGSFVVAHNLNFNEPGSPNFTDCDAITRDYCSNQYSTECNRSGKQRAAWDASQVRSEVESWMRPAAFSKTEDELTMRNVGKTMGDFMEGYDHYYFDRVKTYENNDMNSDTTRRRVSFSNPPAWAAGEHDFVIFPELATRDLLSVNLVSGTTLQALEWEGRRDIAKRTID